MMPCAIRAGSTRTASTGSPESRAASAVLSTIRRLEAVHTNTCVRNPAGRPWYVRSSPINAPASAAANKCTKAGSDGNANVVTIKVYTESPGVVAVGEILYSPTEQRRCS